MEKPMSHGLSGSFIEQPGKASCALMWTKESLTPPMQ